MESDAGSAVTTSTASGEGPRDAAQERLVEAGWAKIRLLSRLEHRRANELLAEELELERRRATEELVPLRPWPLLPDRSFRTYSQGANHVRIHRVLDFVRPGDRVLDIGTGYGYLASVLLRDAEPAYYCGIDLTERLLQSTRQGIETNGSGDTPHALEILNLYDLTPEFVQRHRPDIVLLLEVLEHVPDPELAFRTLGEALDDRSVVLFTVPMLGRLEGVWGHLSLYDEARITSLCRSAGLTIHHVEPVHNTWTLVMASRSAAARARAEALLAGPRGEPEPDPLAGAYSFEPLDPAALDARPTARGVEVISGPDGLSIGVSRGRRGGAILQVPEPELVRLEVTYHEPENLAAVTADARAGGKPRLAWRWSMTERNRPEPRAVTHLFRRGRSARHFAPVRSADPAGVTELALQLDPVRGRHASATIHRLAVVRRAGA